MKKPVALTETEAATLTTSGAVGLASAPPDWPAADGLAAAPAGAAPAGAAPAGGPAAGPAGVGAAQPTPSSRLPPTRWPSSLRQRPTAAARLGTRHLPFLLIKLHQPSGSRESARWAWGRTGLPPRQRTAGPRACQSRGDAPVP